MTRARSVPERFNQPQLGSRLGENTPGPVRPFREIHVRNQWPTDHGSKIHKQHLLTWIKLPTCAYGTIVDSYTKSYVVKVGFFHSASIYGHRQAHTPLALASAQLAFGCAWLCWGLVDTHEAWVDLPRLVERRGAPQPSGPAFPTWRPLIFWRRFQVISHITRWQCTLIRFLIWLDRLADSCEIACLILIRRSSDPSLYVQPDF